MNDKQIPSAPSATGIPIISPVLHFFAMPALVFWRHGFGYAFLRPKSVFLSVSVASFLSCFVIWHEPSLKPELGSAAAFTAAVSALYLLHLWHTFRSQILRSAAHDRYSGTPYLLAFWPGQQRENQQRFIRMVAEPALTLVIAVAVSHVGGCGCLALILMVAAVALALKEAINGWLTLRRGKIVEDGLSDVKDNMPAQPGNSSPPPQPGAKRRRLKRDRQPPPESSAEENDE
jgi:hypothetical protein